jgi:ATP-binding cassette subfamily F protein 3
LRAVCDEFWLVSRGGVAPFDGDLDDYQRYLLDEAKRQREAIKEASTSVAKAARKTQQTKTAASAKPMAKTASPGLKRQLEQIEAQLALLNHEGTALEARLCASPPAAEIAELGKRLKTINKELQRLEDQWLTVSDALETQSPHVQAAVHREIGAR